MRKSIALILESDTNSSTFTSIIKLAGLYGVLNHEKNLTLLAPINAAFEKMTTSVYSRLINESKNKLKRIMEYHILQGIIHLSDLHHGQKIQTLNGNDVNIYMDDGIIRINASTVIMNDKLASNGIIHSIDTLL